MSQPRGFGQSFDNFDRILLAHRCIPGHKTNPALRNSFGSGVKADITTSARSFDLPEAGLLSI